MPQTRCYYKRHLRRTPTWGVPRFRHRFDETLDRGLILPRGLRTVTIPAEQAGSRLEITDDRAGNHPGLHIHRHAQRRAAGSRQ